MARLLTWMHAAGSLLIILLMGVITADVAGRVFFNHPLPGVPELVKMTLVGLVWLQMGQVLKAGAHLRSTFLLDRLSPQGRDLADALIGLTGAAVFALIVWASWEGMWVAWEIGEFEGEHPLRVPTAPVRTLLVAGAGVTAIQFLMMAGLALRRAIGPAAPAGE